jgi:competence protein ComEA
MEDIYRQLENPRQKTFLQVLIAGGLLIMVGLFVLKSGLLGNGTEVEILSESETGNIGSVVAEISGEVVTAGVYDLPENSRIEDLIAAAGGFTDLADTEWIERNLNRAALIVDGQKIYIPRKNEQTKPSSANKLTGDQTTSTAVLSDSISLTNINSASLSELDKLPGIGPKYGQDIIDQRPYSTVDDLLIKGVLGKSLFEKIKNLISVY